MNAISAERRTHRWAKTIWTLISCAFAGVGFIAALAEFDRDVRYALALAITLFLLSWIILIFMTLVRLPHYGDYKGFYTSLCVFIVLLVSGFIIAFMFIGIDLSDERSLQSLTQQSTDELNLTQEFNFQKGFDGWRLMDQSVGIINLDTGDFLSEPQAVRFSGRVAADQYDGIFLDGYRVNGGMPQLVSAWMYLDGQGQSSCRGQIAVNMIGAYTDNSLTDYSFFLGTPMTLNQGEWTLITWGATMTVQFADASGKHFVQASNQVSGLGIYLICDEQFVGSVYFDDVRIYRMDSAEDSSGRQP